MPIFISGNSRPGGRVVLLASLAMCLGASGELFATNGYFNHGMGTKNKAMAGAGIALPDEAMAIVNNPAVAAAVAGRTDIGLAVFLPRSYYESTGIPEHGRTDVFTIGPNDIDAEDQTLLVPYFARSWQVSDDSAFAAALYTRSGINTEYRGGTATFDPDGPGPAPMVTQPGTLGDGDVQWKLSQALLDLAYARQVGERLSLGAAAVLAAQSFSMRGAGSLALLTQTWASSGGSEMPTHLSGNGSDRSYGAGLKLGAHFQWTPTLALGLMAQSKIYMSSLSDYADLLPSGGEFDIPADLKLGLSWRFLDRVVFSVDAEYIFYSDVKALGNTLEDSHRCPTAGRGGTDLSACLGGSNGGGLGWKDIPIIKLGLDWKVGQHWNLRGGASIGDQPVRISQASNNLLTPYLGETTYTFGFTRALGSGKELNLAFMYMEEESHFELSAFDPSQLIYYAHDEMELELSYGWRF